jgi:hypothetical protein
MELNPERLGPTRGISRTFRFIDCHIYTTYIFYSFSSFVCWPTLCIVLFQIRAVEHVYECSTYYTNTYRFYLLYNRIHCRTAIIRGSGTTADTSEEIEAARGEPNHVGGLPRV